MTQFDTLRIGVVGAGGIGRRHARTYARSDGATLVGVADTDRADARSVAAEHGTTVRDVAELLATADAVSIAGPPPARSDVARRALGRGVHAFVQAPVVTDRAGSDRLLALARESDPVLFAGQLDRFDPAVDTVRRILADEEIVGVEAWNLGPPDDRDAAGGVVLDRMVADLAVALSLVEGDPESVAAAGAKGGRHVAAHVRFGGGAVGQFTASHVDRGTSRRLSVTAGRCRVDLDYAGRSVRVTRDAAPAGQTGGTLAAGRRESVVERPTVESADPLARAIDAFLDAVRTDTRPPVDVAEGLESVGLARRIDREIRVGPDRVEGTPD